MRNPHISPRDAEAHEALVTRVLRLLKQAEAVAVRRPQEPVSPAVARLAADLLYDVGAFIPGSAGLPHAAPDYVGLAAQLGQALAGLEAFEARHTVWDGRLKAFAWQLAAGRVQPVARLRQPVAPLSAEARQTHDLRRRLARRLAAKMDEKYALGFRAGQAARAEAAGEAPAGYGEGGREAGGREAAKGPSSARTHAGPSLDGSGGDPSRPFRGPDQGRGRTAP